MAKVQITDTILRDGHQSQAATRMRTDEMLPACEMLDKVGYYSLECWGGATYDACLRFLNEDPWERLRKLRKALPNTKLQMLLRGQNVLGYSHYPDDFVKLFVQKSVENGIDIIRCFDALNDLRNMQTAVKATKKYGGTAEIAENVDLDIADGEALLSFVHERNIGLVVIGPEAPLVDGVADLLRADGVPVFGPNADGAQLEGSKAYSKAFMEANDIPTAAYLSLIHI